MSIETEKSSCPYCSTRLEYRHINLTEKMLICTKKKCLFPFDLDDVSPYIIVVDSSIEKEQDSGSSSSSLLDDKLFNLKKSNPSLDLNESSSAQSKNTSTKFESSPSSLESPSTESYNKSRCSAGSRPPTKLTTQSSARSNKKSTSNSNNSITLKTLGVTLKVDQTDKNKLQPHSTDLKNGSSSVSLSNSDLVSSSNMNEIPAPVVEPSLVNTAGNGLLGVNTAGGSDNGNVLTVGEYTRMLLGKSSIDIDLDNLSLNPDIVDMSMRGNDTMMELDGFLGTFDPLESGNNIDFDSLMANLDGNFMEAGVLNDVSGNNYDIDLNSILVNGNGNIIDSVNSNEVQNNGVSDIHSGKTIFDNINV